MGYWKKDLADTFNNGDIVFLKKNKEKWSLKQFPEVNGGIVALDPFHG